MPQASNRPWEFIHASMGATDRIQEISSSKLFNSSFHAVHVQRNRVGRNIVPTQAPTETFMISVHLREMAGGGLWRNGHYLRAAPIQTSGIRIYDLREAWLKDVGTPYESVNFFIPLEAFAQLTDDLKAPPIDRLSFLNEVGDTDSSLEGLARALLSAMENISEVSKLFADHVFGAVRLRVAAWKHPPAKCAIAPSGTPCPGSHLKRPDGRSWAV